MTTLKDLPEDKAVEIFKTWLSGGIIIDAEGGAVLPKMLNMDRAYSIQKTPDEIDWSHVAPEYKFMARDESGKAWLYTDIPDLSGSLWLTPRNSRLLKAASFTSYNPGTVDWRHSLVERPSFKEGY